MWLWKCLACCLALWFFKPLTLMAASVGFTCQQVSDCPGLNSTTCLEGVCSCKTGYVQTADKTTCVPQVIGRSCISTAEVCGVPHSYCDNGVCACVRPEFVPSSNKTMCLPVMTNLRGPCDEDQQCMNHVLGEDTMCTNRECICRFGATNLAKPCDPRKKLDDWCTHSQQCETIGHASCVQGRCACDPYFVPYSSSRTECIPIATRLGSPCRQHVQCTAAFGDAGLCGEDGRCRCQNRFHFVFNRTLSCVFTRGLKERCSQRDDCWLPLGGGHQNTDCVDNVCVCRAGFEPSDDNQRCSSAEYLHSFLSSSQLVLVVLLTSALHRRMI